MKKRQSKAVRAGQPRSQHGEHSEALFLTSSFVFASAEDAAKRFRGGGNVYSRYTNPTVRTFEERLAALEGAEDCLAFASGMGSILACCLGLCSAGDRIVVSKQVFGATIGLLDGIVARFGVKVDYVLGPRLADWRRAAARRPKPKFLFIETPSNPQLDVYDIAELAAIAHGAGALLIVDNCMCTPFLQQPLKLGADIVMHSATKYIDGQGRVLGGALCGPRRLLREKLLPLLRNGGIAASPFNAWVQAKGLETLQLRIGAMAATAEAVAAEAAAHPAVKRLAYPFHPDHPGAALARRQQKAGGGIVTIELKGGRPAAYRAINAARASGLFSITANFGDAKSTITHPASTTHGRLGARDRQRLRIAPGLIRLSFGLEDAAELRAAV
ncbi:MAG: aminotransferase class I/II-fold pyridoxal phosphate-dependent enzyme, partial [Betaproteobacteria bacterium AqS2]|nr:aminotransferase class I/II-fold pyridoxal phosphate-dependent enzyme [Betaproteobacteria bacterium AqS2]